MNAPLIDRRKPKPEEAAQRTPDPSCPMFATGSQVPASCSCKNPALCTCCVHEPADGGLPSGIGSDAVSAVNAPQRELSSGMSRASSAGHSINPMPPQESHHEVSVVVDLSGRTNQAPEAKMPYNMHPPQRTASDLERGLLSVGNGATIGVFGGEKIVMPEPDSVELQVPADSRKTEVIGRLGEEIVAQFLKQKHATSEEQVVWVNAEKETGYPFDIQVLSANGTISRLIEVKSTSSEAKTQKFEISANELNAAFQFPELYDIVRVVFTDRCVRIVWLDRFAARALSGSLQLIAQWQ
jgi:hypothetical protein